MLNVGTLKTCEMYIFHFLQVCPSEITHGGPCWSHSQCLPPFETLNLRWVGGPHLGKSLILGLFNVLGNISFHCASRCFDWASWGSGNKWPSNRSHEHMNSKSSLEHLRDMQHTPHSPVALSIQQTLQGHGCYKNEIWTQFAVCTYKWHEVKMTKAWIWK